MSCIINKYKKDDIILNMTDNKDYWINEIKNAVLNKKNIV
jgi:hypothetical protein